MEEPRVYDSDYEGSSYRVPNSVTNLSRLPRFGHGSDFTVLLSPDQDGQADYSAGLISLFVSLLIVFVFWTIAIVVFRIMGPANAGFLSGHRFVVPAPSDDRKNLRQRKRPARARVAFLAAAAVSMASALLFVAQGLANVNDAAATMTRSLQTTGALLNDAELIADKLEDVGEQSIKIRDDALRELADLCPNNPNIGDTIGMDILGIADQAKSDLTGLADFIADGLGVFDGELSTVRDFAAGAERVTTAVDLWEWPMKLLVSGLFILPSFLAMGVGLVMLDVDIAPYQAALTYFFMPLFGVTVVACFIFCCALLPISAISADACSGGGSARGGPDDTVLTVYRNLFGADTGMIFQFVAFYTQQCNAEYYPFGFLSSYLSDLDSAVDSTQDAATALSSNQELLEAQCGRTFDSVIDIVERMNVNLKVLRQQADLTLDLVRCEDINRLYVSTVHDAGCTYSVDAMAWIFASSLLMSVCGLIIITLRASYLPVEIAEPGDPWIAKPALTESESRGSTESADPAHRGAHGPAASATHPAVDPLSFQVAQVNGNEFEIDHDPTGQF